MEKRPLEYASPSTNALEPVRRPWLLWILILAIAAVFAGWVLLIVLRGLMELLDAQASPG